ncbi:hypothetical protein ABEB36_012368 [Hypothenemus hampei]|uniref:FUN14 domain-containing protein 1 n=1 Tax=Hypothenemus hampei TaxID=57062 RepID=A0ABD1EBA5_HYPHA
MAPSGLKKVKDFFSKYVAEDKYDSTTQVLMGAGSGWFTGFLAMRVAKTTAFAVGGGLILLQLATESGVVKINWKKIDKVKKLDDHKNEWIEEEKEFRKKLMDFFTNNTPFSMGFIGGFLIGMSF